MTFFGTDNTKLQSQFLSLNSFCNAAWQSDLLFLAACSLIWTTNLYTALNPPQVAFYQLSWWILHCQMLHRNSCWNLTLQQDPSQPETQNYCDIQIAINLSFNINITYGFSKITFGLFKRYEILRTHCTKIHPGEWATESAQRTNFTNLYPSLWTVLRWECALNHLRVLCAWVSVMWLRHFAFIPNFNTSLGPSN